MNLEIIIKGLLIIFILHIIILNINYNYDIGNKKKVENFNNDSPSEVLNEKSLQFLNSNNEDEESKKKLMKYINIEEPKKLTEFEDKNINKVNPSNTFLGNNNVPNFESNVANISKFYKVNFDNLDEDELKSTSLENLKLNLDEKTVNPTKDIDHIGRKSTENPDVWSYKNEIPMNGGSMNGIVGFDSLESQFSIYNPNKLNLQDANSNNFNNIPHDDLRKPIIYEN